MDEREMTDRELVRLYWPVALRPAFDALFAIDDALGEVVASASQPALGAIRLAWWRDALERLDQRPPPPEPRLQAVAAELLPRGVSGSDLARISEGWAALFEEERDPHAIGARGEALFAAGATLLGANHPGLGQAGRWFALADVARRHLSPVLSAEVTPVRFPRCVATADRAGAACGARPAPWRAVRARSHARAGACLAGAPLVGTRRLNRAPKRN